VVVSSGDDDEGEPKLPFWLTFCLDLLSSYGLLLIKENNRIALEMTVFFR
jgi:hypothetical protein